MKSPLSVTRAANLWLNQSVLSHANDRRICKTLAEHPSFGNQMVENPDWVSKAGVMPYLLILVITA
jgi:hypothetical protein